MNSYFLSLVLNNNLPLCFILHSLTIKLYFKSSMIYIL